MRASTFRAMILTTIVRDSHIRRERQPWPNVGHCKAPVGSSLQRARVRAGDAATPSQGHFLLEPVIQAPKRICVHVHVGGSAGLYVCGAVPSRVLRAEDPQSVS